MKIFEFTRNAIRHIAEAAELIPKRSDRVTLPDGFSAKLPAQLTNDVYEVKGFNFADIRLGARLNGGRDAEVFDIKGHPEWVLRWEYDSTFDARQLRPVEDNALGVVASTPDGAVKVLKKLQGEPLYEKDWDIFRDPDVTEYFSQLSKIEEIPDEAFIKYMQDLLELRKKGYQVDRTNPNNILYDSKTHTFNLVDIRQKSDVKPEIVLKDFYPFVDAARAQGFYRNSHDGTRNIFAGYVTRFLDRMLKLAEQQGVKLEIEEIDHDKLQDFMVYLYRNDEEMLKLLRKP